MIDQLSWMDQKTKLGAYNKMDYLVRYIDFINFSSLYQKSGISKKLSFSAERNYTLDLRNFQQSEDFPV